MKTDLTIFKSTDMPNVICEFVDDNSVKCHCYLDHDAYCRDLYNFIAKRKNIAVYIVAVADKSYTSIGPYDKVEPGTKDIPESFYDDKNVELVIY